MSKEYHESFFNKRTGRNPNSNSPQQTHQTPNHLPTTLPMYQSPGIPAISTHQPMRIPPSCPSGSSISRLPNPHPYYAFLSNLPIKEEPKSPPPEQMKCHSCKRKWQAGISLVDSASSYTNKEGSSHKSKKGKSKEPEKEPVVNAEFVIRISSDSDEITTPIMGQYPIPYDESIDPYEQIRQELHNQALASFPPFQGKIPSEEDQAKEIREQNKAAEIFFNLPLAETKSTYSDPKNHYDVVKMGYRNPPPIYGNPFDTPKSQEEHLDRALQETDELRKRIAVEKRERRRVGKKLLRKCKKLTKMVKKFIKD